MSTYTDPTNDPASTGLTSQVVPGDLFARHQTITGLRALADFLEANPGVPVKEFGAHYTVTTRSGDDAAAAALVDQVAPLLGAEITDDRPHGGHYIASKTFGRIVYQIIHIPDRRMEEYHAHLSYSTNIRLDDTDQDDQDSDQGTGQAA
ncbi:hypothetical protein [Actinomadura welshii]|uniref:hypothetical protein n=1 Tax=Actinomadura welshii TaxID=3103817 RepID=UPI0003ACFFC6|nr:hypothetical protein [Actinomadura madurae]